MRFKTIRLDITEQDVFFIADPHFLHKNVIEYCNRPFETVEEMNLDIMTNWNNAVDKKDIIFIAGDFCFGSTKTWVYLLDHLNGIKYLAAGNHDKSIPANKFVDVQHRFNIRIMGDEEVKEGQWIVVDHYPMLSWYKSHAGSIQLYGHDHFYVYKKNEVRLRPNQVNISVDVRDFTPINYQRVKTIVTQQNLI